MGNWIRRELKIWKRTAVTYTPDGWKKVSLVSHIVRYWRGHDLR